MFNLPVYTESHLQANAAALYRVKPEAAEVQKMSAGTAPYYIHELFHHLDKTLALNLDPATMPRQVLDGLRQFDYQPGRQNLRVAVKEGGAEWLRMRETNSLQPRTPEQRAAAEYMEAMLGKRKGVIEKLDRVRDLFRDFARQTPSEQFGGLMSRTGEPARPEVTPGETAANFLQRTRQAAADNLLDDAMPAKRAEGAAQARGEVFEPGKKLSEVIATTRLRNVPDANEMEQGGVFAYDANGKHRVLSKPLADAVKGLSAEEAAPGADLDRYMHALRVLHDLSTGAVARSPEATDGAHATIKEYMADPHKFLRLEHAAQNVTNLFNATLDAMVMAGRITRARADYLKNAHPFYVSEAHITEPDFRSVAPFGGRRKGEEPRSASFLKQRTGSGEQMVNWLDALRDRFRFTASMVNDQAKFRAILDLSQREGVGEWLNPGQPGEGPGGEPAGWPRDGTKPSITGFVEGEPVTVRVNDRAFYEMVTGTQGEGGKVQPFLKSLGDVLQATRIPQAVRTGGTILNPLWHLKNFIRDPILYAQRTIADKGTIRNLGDLLNWYGKSLSFYSRALLAGGADRVEVT
ncbi:MAG TPA: hypothetical protein VNX28_16565, partial [Gemmataceae bacterium]|nr:hypothetical protein [Gemmataceae bacterium]